MAFKAFLMQYIMDIIRSNLSGLTPLCCLPIHFGSSTVHNMAPIKYRTTIRDSNFNQSFLGSPHKSSTFGMCSLKWLIFCSLINFLLLKYWVQIQLTVSFSLYSQLWHLIIISSNWNWLLLPCYFGNKLKQAATCF